MRTIYTDPTLGTLKTKYACRKLIAEYQNGMTNLITMYEMNLEIRCVSLHREYQDVVVSNFSTHNHQFRRLIPH